MLVNHEIQTVVNSMRKDELNACFAEAYTVVNQLIEIRSALERWHQGEDDEDELFDNLDTYSYFAYGNLQHFSDWAVSKDVILNKYLMRVMSSFDVVQKNVHIISESGVVPTQEEYESLRNGLYRVISGILYFIIYEFSLRDTVLAARDSDDVPVDEVLSHYCASKGKDLIDFVVSVCELGDKYKFKLDFFDDYPDKEADFEKMMGPSIVGIDESALTLDLVNAVIEGRLTPSELLEVMNVSDEVM